jgi:hypothetical protein
MVKRGILPTFTVTRRGPTGAFHHLGVADRPLDFEQPALSDRQEVRVFMAEYLIHGTLVAEDDKPEAPVVVDVVRIEVERITTMLY